jgi:hypothetical protein
MAEKKNNDDEKRKLTREQVAAIEAHDVPPSEQHQAQTLRERSAALPDNPLFALEGVQGVPSDARRLGGTLHTEYPLPHRNEYPDDAQREAIEAIQKRLPQLRRTLV